MLEVKENIGINKKTIIKVIGVGGAGNKAITRMERDGIDYVELIGVNTAVKDIKACGGKTIQIGEKITNGMGAGARPEVGEQAAEESRSALEQAVAGADLVIVTCGMGGGTGTGAAPYIAQLSKSKGILTIGVVTKPFTFEGSIRRNNAKKGIEKLKEAADAIIEIPNDKLLSEEFRKMSTREAFERGDEVLRQMIQAITEIINVPADINVDMADVTTVMQNKGNAYIGIGSAKGKQKAIIAMEKALASPFLDTKIIGATDVIINFVGDVTLYDAQDAIDVMTRKTGTGSNIIFGFRYEKDMADACYITIIATCRRTTGQWGK